MKFYKIIMALFVLLGLQNSVLFGSEVTPDLEEIKTVAVRVLNNYINTSARQRTAQQTDGAKNALAIMRLYQSKGGELTANENQLVARTTGLLPQARAARVRGVPTRTATRATTVSRPTAATRTRVVRTRPTAVRAGRPAARPTRALPTRTVRTRPGVAAPMVTAPRNFNETITYWFGGDLSPLMSDGVVNNEFLQIAFDNIKAAQKQTNFTDGQVWQLINNTLAANQESGLNSMQKATVMNALARLFRATAVTVPVTMPSIVGAGEKEFEIKIGEQPLQKQIMLLFGMGNLSTKFFKDGTVNDEMIMEAWNAIKPYSQGRSSDDIYSMISRAMLNNKNSNLTLSQQAMVLAEMNKILRAGLPVLTSAGGITMPGSLMQVAPQSAEGIWVQEVAPATLQQPSSDIELEEIAELLPPGELIQVEPSEFEFPKRTIMSEYPEEEL